MPVKSIHKLTHLRGKSVLIRVDFNVPIKKGEVKEEFKIEKSIPTIAHFLREGAKVILVSHLGRPKNHEKKFSLKPLVPVLENLVHEKVHFLTSNKYDKTYWEKARELVSEMKDSGVMLLENIRFFIGEAENDKNLAKELAALADYFVLDGFAVAHRDSASVTGVAKLLPSYAGDLLMEEIKGLSKVIKNPKKPLVLVLAGIKMETKIPVLKKLLPLADHILIGGGIFNTYLKAKGRKVGSSIVDENFSIEDIKYLEKKKVLHPVDVIVGTENGKKAKAVKVSDEFSVDDPKMAIYDIGPQTIKLYAKYIKNAATLVWNGAMGKFEVHPYQYGTNAIARLFAARSMGKAFGVCGGGETIEVLNALRLLEDIDLASTGGGAMLEFLSGKVLPGIKALN